MKRLLLVFALATIAVPAAGHAEPIGGECTGTLAAPITGTSSSSCSSTFSLPAPGNGRYVSDIGTFANIVEFGSSGALTVTWLDASGATIVAYDCSATGLSLDGLADIARLNCVQSGAAAPTYVPGVQTVVVGATIAPGDCPATSCTFHGRLNLSEVTDLF